MNRGASSVSSVSRRIVIATTVMGTLFMPIAAQAADTSQFGGHHSDPAQTLAVLGILVVLAKMAGSLAERFKQVSVLGELMLGILLGLPVLMGYQFFEEFKTNELVLFVSELAVIILLFQAGVESNLHEMKKVGMRAFIVASVGVIVPFILGTWVVSPLLFPGRSMNFYIFIGATMTATSVGITARVFKDLKISNTLSAKIVLGAAIFDDVIGLLILAVVNAMVKSGHIGGLEIVLISLKAFGFLLISIVAGRVLAPYIGASLSRIQRGVGMKMAFALAFAFGYAYVGSLFGLAPIVGAFAAGLVLDTVHFKRFSNPRLTNEIETSLSELPSSQQTTEILQTIETYREHHVEHLVEGFGQWFIPIFFVITGMSIDLKALTDPHVIIATLVLSIVAVAGKVVSGFFAGKGSNWKIVGFGMVPRGEVGLIFASIARATGVIDNDAFTVLVLMIVVTTFITPLILPRLVKPETEEIKKQ